MINACVIGLGQRGAFLVEKVLLKSNDIKIVSVCDIYEDRIKNAVDLVKGVYEEPKGFTDYKEALNVKGIDAVFIYTGWERHAEIALYAMEKGIAVASEVGSEYSLDACFNLVKTQERTKTPYMLLENCCWGDSELLALNMARKGLFGTIVHCSGAYAHDLREEIAYGKQNRHYRFDNYLKYNKENYPTHELGPIAKVLDLNRGNRILTVSSFASKAVGLKEYIESRPDATEEMKNANFLQGDIVTTVLTCENGETIMLRLDTTLPRSYDRDFTLRGTKGSFYQSTNSVYFDGEKEYWSNAYYLKHHLNNANEYKDKYLPDIWKNVTPEEKQAGHGGMDYFCTKAFVDALKTGAPMPVDVYDSALWQAVGVLSEKSIKEGGMPQAMPDFTNGEYKTRKRLDVCPL